MGFPNLEKYKGIGVAAIPLEKTVFQENFHEFFTNIIKGSLQGDPGRNLGQSSTEMSHLMEGE